MAWGEPPFTAAVIGHTGRGDYGHGLDLAMRDHPSLRLLAVADPDAAGRARSKERLRVPNAYADYREMLDREKPQFAAVAPRWLDRHREMTLECASRGVHVFCEKPLAQDLASCDAIVEACDSRHVKIAMALQTRYSPTFAQARELVRSGALGKIVEIRGRGKEDQRGGGEDLMVLGTHIMDLFRAFLGNPVSCFARVSEAGRPVTPKDVRPGNEGIGPLAGDQIDAMYTFDNSSAVAYFGTMRPTTPQERNPGRFGLTVYGTLGCLEIRTGYNAPTFWLNQRTWSNPNPNPKSAPGSGWVPITSQGPGKPETDLERTRGRDFTYANVSIVTDLIAAVKEDRPPLADVRDGRAALEMILAVYASHVAGKPVSLPLTQRAKHPLEDWPA